MQTYAPYNPVFTPTQLNVCDFFALGGRIIREHLTLIRYDNHKKESEGVKRQIISYTPTGPGKPVPHRYVQRSKIERCLGTNGVVWRQSIDLYASWSLVNACRLMKQPETRGLSEWNKMAIGIICVD